MKQMLIAFALSCILAPAFAFADHQHKMAGPGPMKEPTKEERMAMANMHTKMAECLKTEKPMTTCHKEMMDSCPMAKEGHCPMMAMGMMGGEHEHHHGKMPMDMKDTKKTTTGTTDTENTGE